jgi:hypothetical protein
MVDFAQTADNGRAGPGPRSSVIVIVMLLSIVISVSFREIRCFWWLS